MASITERRGARETKSVVSCPLDTLSQEEGCLRLLACERKASPSLACRVFLIEKPYSSKRTFSLVGVSIGFFFQFVITASDDDDTHPLRAYVATDAVMTR